MRKEMGKSYSPGIEAPIYDRWLSRRYFHAEPDETKTPYTIVIPPPNVTGQLHIGHAFQQSLQDALIRYKRMRGFNALWLPGTDHASISTEVRIVNQLKAEGKNKADLGREGFLSRAWDWKAQYGGRIIEQLKTMGFSCDWERERFTMDEGLNKAVTEVFCRLYEKGLIYRAEKLINWCSTCKTTISDAEVGHEDRDGFLWYFKYPVESGGFLTFATTRPETMLGDTAIAVHPQDERYKDLIGGFVTVPVVERKIPIIADEYVDREYGAGVVKITPGHDPNDYEVGIRHNLPIINILNDDGVINENGGAYKGLHKTEARKRIIEEFKSLGLYIKEEKITHSVGCHERCHDAAEPLMKLQWFVKMAPLAKPAIESFDNGELNIYPERLGKVYRDWLKNIRDWCVSRQLWWGHRIPAYHCADCGHITVSRVNVENCEKCGSGNVRQDEDVLDTWFSSALWPFSTLGWPDETPELKYFYPTDTLVTSYDIIFFWVVRMVFSAIEHTGRPPFRDVLFNGLIRDAKGKKMSKSSDNGVDPLDVVARAGSDALRLALITGNTIGNDLRFHEEKVESARNFLNKLWNAARFILMNMDDTNDESQSDELTAADKWILSRANQAAKECADLIESYELGLAASVATNFVWDELCDWYIEFVKPRLYAKEGEPPDKTKNAALYALREALTTALKLLHPFLPFITEEIYCALYGEDTTILYAEWPLYREARNFPGEEADIQAVKEAIKAIRALRAEKNVAPASKPHIIIVTDSKAARENFRNSAAYIEKLAGATGVTVTDNYAAKESDVKLVTPSASIYIPLNELSDSAKEKERLAKEIERLLAEVKRCEAKLNNQGFTLKAPEAILAQERGKLAKYKEMLAAVTASYELR